MYNIICITNRQLCKEDFLTRIEQIAHCSKKLQLTNPDVTLTIVLREKDLSPLEYKELAIAVLHICKIYDCKCILHNFYEVAKELNVTSIHLPLPVLRQLSEDERCRYSCLGTSCHSLSDVLEAKSLGCTYVTLGHIFDTDCKKGLPGRGCSFLLEVCQKSPLPVYAIGGIQPSNVSSVLEQGADGICVMSLLMKCENVEETVNQLLL